jgi:8-oxo-dGTP pyrophosphatase MutT (NUDIX family)
MKETKEVKEKTKKMSTKSKKITMYMCDDENKPVTAAGALFYKKVNKKLMLLVIETNNQYEDIGGKIDPSDETIYEAAAREIEEETNEVITKDSIIERLEEAQYIYVPRSKYIIFLIEANEEESKLTKQDFGDREIYEGYNRTIGWLSKEELVKEQTIKYKLNWRMKSKSLFEKLKEIENSYKFKKKFF